MSYFSEYGEITRMKMLPNTGMAFVCFKDRDGAKMAKEQAGNKTLKGKHLYIAYCEPKEQRQAHIEESKDKKAYEN